MKELIELIKTKISIFLFIVMLMLISLTFIKSSSKTNDIESVLLLEKISVPFEQNNANASVLGKSSSNLKQAALGNRVRQTKLKTSYSAIDAKENGNHTCVCPICELVYINKTACDNKCSKCRKNLLNAVYAGDGYLTAKAKTVAKAKITYENTVKFIIKEHCFTCHGVPPRELTNYKKVKMRVDSGMLKLMLKPGGMMTRFIQANESKQILQWIKTGAPEK